MTIQMPSRHKIQVQAGKLKQRYILGLNFSYSDSAWERAPLSSSRRGILSEAVGTINVRTVENKTHKIEPHTVIDASKRDEL